MFKGLHNGQRDLAMRAGVAIAVRRLLEDSGIVPHEFLGEAAHERVGLRVGLLSSSESRWTQYAEGVERSILENGAESVNEHWGDTFTGPVVQAAETVADIILEAVDPLSIPF